MDYTKVPFLVAAAEQVTVKRFVRRDVVSAARPETGLSVWSG